jgi:hypothetical protein
MKTKLTAEWKIELRDKQGKLLKRLCKDGDLILLNWKKLASALGLPCGNTTNLSLVDENGVTATYGVYYWEYLLTRLGSYNRSGIAIIVGSDNTPPNENDYKLGKKWGDSGEIPITISNPSPNEWELSASATFTPSNPQTLGELGIKWYGESLYKWFLLARDVLLQPITVPAGASVTISYTLKARSSG